VRVMETAANIVGSLVAAFTVAAALAGLVHVFLSRQVTAEKDAALAQFQTESRTAIAEANARVAAADATAAEANKQAAEAYRQTAVLNERAAQAERAMAEANLRLEEVRMRQARVLRCPPEEFVRILGEDISKHPEDEVTRLVVTFITSPTMRRRFHSQTACM
jgi:hypothetical protein